MNDPYENVTDHRLTPDDFVKVMDQRTIEAIRSVVDYLYDDEHADYMEQDDEGRENHIYNSIVYLDNLLNEN